MHNDISVIGDIALYVNWDLIEDIALYVNWDQYNQKFSPEQCFGADNNTARDQHTFFVCAKCKSLLSFFPILIAFLLLVYLASTFVPNHF